METILCTEAAPVALSADEAEGDVWDNVVIELDRWGTTGYYPKDVLIRDAAIAYPKGTPICIDHAADDRASAPSKSVAGVFVEAARHVVLDDGREVLKAKMKIYPDEAAWVRPRAKDGVLAMSIRTPMKYEMGTRDGRYGKVATEMAPSFSVDIVSRAGAGGAFGTMVESANMDLSTLFKEEEGAIVPITAEESATIAAEAAKAVMSALEPKFTALESQITAVDGKVTAQESAVTPVTPSEVRKAIRGAKLDVAGEDAVYTAFEADTAKFDADKLDSVIATETERIAKATDKKDDLGGGQQTAQESGETKLPSGWSI